MLPFLLDDVARLHQQDMLREAEMDERAKGVANASNAKRLPRRLRIRSGEFFMILGVYLTGSGSATVGNRLDRAT